MISFTKMSGAGNDFIVFDDRAGELRGDLPELVRRLCTRGMSVGADGVILAHRSKGADVRMVYYNADGGRAALCANGARCLARFAVHRGLVKGPSVRLDTDAGVLQAEVHADGRVTLPVPGPFRVDDARPVYIDALTLEGSFAVVGVPHYVLPVKNLWIEGIEGLGRKVRHHADFAPDGVNVDFVFVKARDRIQIRTYERGVERETLSCGSGCIASALTLFHRGLVEPPVTLETRSGIDLVVDWSVPQAGDAPAEVRLIGDARLVFEGFLETEAAGFDPALRSA